MSFGWYLVLMACGFGLLILISMLGALVHQIIQYLLKLERRVQHLEAVLDRAKPSKQVIDSKGNPCVLRNDC